MDRESSSAIDELAAGMNCPAGFECRRSESRGTETASDVVGGSYLECRLDYDRRGIRSVCGFSIPFGGAFYCGCPVRLHLTRSSAGGEGGVYYEERPAGSSHIRPLTSDN